MTATHLPNPDARTSGQAIWSLVLGILSTTCLWIVGSIPAIILGILAIKKVDRSEGQLQGKGLAIAGISTGGVGVLLGLIPLGILASLTFPAFLKVKEKAEQAKQISEMRMIAVACIEFSSQNAQKFPKELSELIPDYLDSEDRLAWSRSGDSSPSAKMPYRYRPGDFKHPNEPFLAAPAPIDGKIAISFVDGRVELVTEEEFVEDYADSFP